MVPKEREVSLEKIKNNAAIKVILISFKAGSTGLNLTVCNHGILVGMWWNPALEVSMPWLFALFLQGAQHRISPSLLLF